MELMRVKAIILNLFHIKLHTCIIKTLKENSLEIVALNFLCSFRIFIKSLIKINKWVPKKTISGAKSLDASG